MMSPTTGPATLSLSLIHPCSSLMLSPWTGFRPKTTGPVGGQSSISRPIRDRALQIPWK
jgi:hypothetical protein